MAIRKIARMGHPVLARPASPIADPTAPAVAALVADMIETMEDAGGTGIAAPQIHEPVRLVVFEAGGPRAAGPDPRGACPRTVLVNPEIEILGEAMEEDWEGCLSVPGLRGRVPRYLHLRYRGLGLDGRPIEREAVGFHARVVQHECDHLDGVLYPARMRDPGALIFESEWKHHLPQAASARDHKKEPQT
ncbi:MAG: peptide deformylase [Alphaproteobacteria bacterium]|nr:peptide deformylase [Alphaproteobacteria bacterium]